MSEPSEWLPFVAGPAGVVGLWKSVEWLVASRLKRGEAAEEKAEESRDGKLDQVLAVVQKMERELAVMASQLGAQAAAVATIEGRVEGISRTYAPRLSALEQQGAVLADNVAKLWTDAKERRRR